MPTIGTHHEIDLDAITTIRRSPVLEMLESAKSILEPARNPEWTDVVRETLGSAFVSRLRERYEPLHGGQDLAEFAFDVDDQSDLPGFIDHVESLTPRRFLFLVLGRVFPESELPEEISAAAVEAFLAARGVRDDAQHLGADFSWCDDLPRMQSELVSLWRDYFNGVFRLHKDENRAEYEKSIRELAEIRERGGALELLRAVTGHDWLPPPIPEDTSYRELVFVPLRHFAKSHQMYFGYGNITVLYDLRWDATLQSQQQERRRRILRIAGALGDKNRLKILQLIAADDFKYNGKRVAKCAALSTSVVSRHLKQLREAELIEEHSPDNRNVLYRLNYDAVASLSDEIVRYLKDL